MSINSIGITNAQIPEVNVKSLEEKSSSIIDTKNIPPEVDDKFKVSEKVSDFEAKHPKLAKFGKFLKNLAKEPKDMTTGEKIGHTVAATLLGAASGAAIIALGISPVGMAVVSAAVAGVAGAALGGAFGGLLGAFAGGKAGKYATIGAGTVGTLCAAGGAVGGYAQGAVLVGIASAIGGPLGGAAAGGILSAASSIYKYFIKG